MTNRYFYLRLNCTYQGSENNIDDLAIESRNDKGWEKLDLNIRSPGFLLFINGLFSCQHLYLRTNSAERNLLLESATGDLQVTTNEVWRIQSAIVTFNVKLKSGLPTEDDINYIIDRMGHCPVSTNLLDSIELVKAVNFDH
jgi:hypothetical protein